MNKNLMALLNTISVSEGTFGIGDNGYNVLVGGGYFEGYHHHPNKRIFIKRINDYSTAAGRYQILFRYWEEYVVQLELEDCEKYPDGAFGKAAQDAIAIQMIKECKAFGSIIDGKFSEALGKCKSRWASLPGAVQHVHTTVAGLQEHYIKFGGTIA